MADVGTGATPPSQGSSSSLRKEVSPPNVSDQLAALSEAGVKFVRLSYPDLHGVARSKDISIAEFEDLCVSGVAFCEAIMTVDLRHNVVSGAEHGFQDIVAKPDMGTLVRLPWDASVAWCLADLERVETGEPYGGDPRGTLRRAVVGWSDVGYSPELAPELEFYLLERDVGAPRGYRLYVDADSHVYTAGEVADPRGVVRRMLIAAGEMGLGAFAANHEFGRAQYEINLKHCDALESADRAFRFKVLVKEMAARDGLLATFMGKPWNDDEGSGFHVHLSLAGRGHVNSFLDPQSGAELSLVCRRFIAGVLEHAEALMAFFNPTVNAYRRINPEALVPTRVNWGHDNRLCFVRVPRERGAATRIEVRVGDGAANAYLAYAALLFAGLDGVRREIEPPDELEGNVRELPEELQGRPLPTSLPEGLDALEGDSYMVSAIGQELVDTYLRLKRYELDRYRRWVSDWEFEEYSHHL